MNCKKCGRPIRSGMNFCDQCGSSVKQNNALPIVIALTAAIGIVLLIGVFVLFFLFRNNGNDQVDRSYGMEPMKPHIQETEAPSAEESDSVPPDFSEVSATSYRSSDTDSGGNTYHYFPRYATDGDWSTCWATNPNNDPTPSITLKSNTPQHVTGIRFSNGYFRTKETYTKNRRITKAVIFHDEGSQTIFCSPDQYGVLQEITLEHPVDTSYITLQVLESVDGGWHDISISEIEVF